jgi:hypothetical protein
MKTIHTTKNRDIHGKFLAFVSIVETCIELHKAGVTHPSSVNCMIDTAKNGGSPSLVALSPGIVGPTIGGKSLLIWVASSIRFALSHLVVGNTHISIHPPTDVAEEELLEIVLIKNTNKIQWTETIVLPNNVPTNNQHNKW